MIMDFEIYFHVGGA